MSDTQPSQLAPKPDEKVTVAMAPPPPWAIEQAQRLSDIAKIVSDGFARQDKRADAADDRFDKLERKVSEGFNDFNKRVTALEIKEEQASRANSARNREPSQFDLEVKNEVAAEREARKRMEEKVDKVLSFAGAVESLGKKPWAQKLGAAMLPVVLLAIAALGAKLKMQIDHLEEKPQTVQAAPTVYVPVPMPTTIVLDGGAK